MRQKAMGSLLRGYSLMRTIYWAFTEEVGECEAMFDSDGHMLGMWSSNDGHWRNEYFSPFMRELGFEVKHAPDWMVDKLIEQANEMWG
jgi:hypothetical protein